MGEPTAKKTKVEKSTFSAVKTSQDFDDIWGDQIVIESEPTWMADQLRWNFSTESQLTSICSFIKLASPKWAANIKGILNPNLGESILYHLITDVIMSVAELNNCKVIVSPNPLVTEDSVMVASAAIAKAQSRESSMDRVPPQPQSSPPLPPMIDTTIAEELASVYLAIERQIQSTLFNTGHVEIVLIKQVDDRDKRGRHVVRQHEICAIEAKPNIINEKERNAGFFQGCSYMAAMLDRAMPSQDVVYGITTDYDNWIFMKITRSKGMGPHVISYSKRIPFAMLDNKALLNTSVFIVAYLFEISNISLDIDIAQSMNKAQTNNLEFSNKFVEQLKAHQNTSVSAFREVLNLYFAT